ncbi:MAG: Beta-lactamase [Ferruginibacter sp.]|nr:Beta-lactamase [Ferruginibacter sp.]
MQRFVFIICAFFIVSSAGAQDNRPLKLSHLTGDFYVFTTYNLYKGNRIPANGMYLVTTDGVVLFDTPWDSTQFQPLLDTIRARHHQEVLLCIATHFHEDRTGGLEFYRQRGIKTYTTRYTDELSKNHGMKRAEFLMDTDSLFRIGGYSFQTFYPGKGHAPDNIVIWFQQQKILYGGCLIKSVEDHTLGNLSDASVTDYAQTIRQVKQHCPHPRYILPGHNDWTNIHSLKHTLKMARRLARQQ